MSDLTTVTTETFEAEVLKNDIPVIVDFYADWCPPCRALGPILDRLASAFVGKIKFVKINSDDEGELANQFNVTGLPTIVFMEGGENIGQIAGLPDENELRTLVEQWVDSRNAA